MVCHSQTFRKENRGIHYYIGMMLYEGMENVSGLTSPLLHFSDMSAKKSYVDIIFPWLFCTTYFACVKYM